MRVELVRNKYLLCGHILKSSEIKVGQKWSASSGSDTFVVVVSVDDFGYVTYEGEHQSRHEKEAFAFQCRYCLVLEDNKIPDWLTQYV
jgi:hypothetical protein